jgi:hypothetical protein
MGERMFMIKSKVVGRPSVVSDDLVQSVDQKICEKWQFTISGIMDRLGYHQFCQEMGSENAHGCAQNAENGFDFDFLQPYHKDGNKFLSHTV